MRRRRRDGGLISAQIACCCLPAVATQPFNNGNGLADCLVIDLLVHVETAGSYTVQTMLADRDGNILTGNVQYIGTLAVETHTIPFEFWGKDLRNAGVDGPYTLTSLFILYKRLR